MNKIKNVSSHFGIYGLIKEGCHILLIKKALGAYKGMYDLPGGSPEDGEPNEKTLLREIKEETGLDIITYKQLDSQVVTLFYEYKINNEKFLLKHSALLYKVENYTGTIKSTPDGADSLGAEFVDILCINENNSSPFVMKALSYLKI